MADMRYAQSGHDAGVLACVDCVLTGAPAKLCRDGRR